MLNNTSVYSYSSAIPWTVAFSFQFLLSIIGNSLILWIIYKDNRLKTTTNYLVANMAVSDLLAGVVGFPRQIVWINTDREWMISGDIGDVLCKLVYRFINSLCYTVSVSSCILIAIDRYHAVARPFSESFLSKMKRIVAGIWILGVAINSPYLYFHHTVKVQDRLICRVQENKMSSYKAFRYTILTLTSIFPVVLIIITYILTICKLYRHKAPGLQTSALRRREQQNRKVLKMAVTIVALLYLCHGLWSSFVILTFEKIYIVSPDEFWTFVDALIFVVHISLVSNFFIYLIFNDIYRENVKTLTHKCCLKLKRICFTNRQPRDPNREPAVAVIELTGM